MPALPRFEKVNPLACRLGEAFDEAKSHGRNVFCAIDFPGPGEPGWAQLEYLPEQEFPKQAGIPLFLFGERLHGTVEQWKPEAPNPDSPFNSGGDFQPIGSVAISKDRSVSLVVNGASVRLDCMCLGWTLLGTAADGSRYTLAIELLDKLH